MNLPNWLRSTRAYWIVTALMGLFMASGALFDVANTADAVRLITGLGYPGYLVRFLGVLKLAGVAAIVVGRFPRLKQWRTQDWFLIQEARSTPLQRRERNERLDSCPARSDAGRRLVRLIHADGRADRNARASRFVISAHDLVRRSPSSSARSRQQGRCLRPYSLMMGAGHGA
jgi:DoxX-like family